MCCLIFKFLMVLKYEINASIRKKKHKSNLKLVIFYQNHVSLNVSFEVLLKINCLS